MASEKDAASRMTHLTDTDWLANVLADGEWHPLEQIILRSQRERGHGLTVHSRACELRKRDGVTVEQRSEHVAGRVRSYYRLSLEEPSPNPSREATGGAWDGNGSSSESASPASAEVVAGSLHLFDVEAAA